MQKPIKDAALEPSYGFQVIMHAVISSMGLISVHDPCAIVFNTDNLGKYSIKTKQTGV